MDVGVLIVRQSDRRLLVRLGCRCLGSCAGPDVCGLEHGPAQV